MWRVCWTQTSTLALSPDEGLVELLLDGVHEGVVTAATDPVEVVHVEAPDHHSAQAVLYHVVHLCTHRHLVVVSHWIVTSCVHTDT